MLLRFLSSVFVLVVVSNSFSFGEAQVFYSGVGARSHYPYSSLDGAVYYEVRGRYDDRWHPIHHCILFHGYGVSQNIIDYLFHESGRGARVAHNIMARRGKSPVRAFVYAYTGGPNFIERLLAGICDEVYLTVTEAAETSVQEFTERSEAFLKQVACPLDHKVRLEGQKPCAVWGHSLGGAVATAIAHRCREARRLPSGQPIGLGPDGCRQLAKVYASSAAIGGVGLASVIQGARQANDWAFIERLSASLELNIKIVPRFEARAFCHPAGSLFPIIDVFSDKCSETNPMWFNLSPLSVFDEEHMFGEERSISLAKGGWFVGEYAAAASAADLNRFPSQPPGCGTPWWRACGVALSTEHLRQPPLVQRILDRKCMALESFSTQAHQAAVRSYFELGTKYFRQAYESGGRPVQAAFLAPMTWQSYLLTDGIVEADSALSVCRNTYASGSQAPSPHCRLFSGNEALNHFAIAGYATEAVEHVVKEWAQ